MKKKQKTLNNKVLYDLACGNNKQKGHVGIDIVKKNTQAKIEWNLLKFPWPIKDNSADGVYCSHFLEHIPHIDSYNDYLFQFMDEIYRILKPNGTATFIAPYYTSQRAIQDPTHHRSIGEATFLYFQEPWRKLNKLEHYPIKANFEVVSINHSVSQEYNGRAQEAVQHAGLHFWNVIEDIIVVLKKI